MSSSHSFEPAHEPKTRRRERDVKRCYLVRVQRQCDSCRCFFVGKKQKHHTPHLPNHVRFTTTAAAGATKIGSREVVDITRLATNDLTTGITIVVTGRKRKTNVNPQRGTNLIREHYATGGLQNSRGVLCSRMPFWQSVKFQSSVFCILCLGDL